MTKTMLIGAAHPEETRVALVNNGRVEDFDFETTGSEQLRGNIYLAKVTRVEPSLQACFVEYGGNRHGFLAFSEIHPDYYQLPQEDREALLEEAAREASQSADEDVDDDDEHDDDHDIDSDDDTSDDEADDNEDSAEGDKTSELDVIDADSDDSDTSGADTDETPAKPAQRKRSPRKSRGFSSRRYKIQEVIRRRQVLLVQVVKEERGNKGAALTTYLSLAGRYSVLMPNTPRGGGISRKIANGSDRKRLKTIMSNLDLPKGMGLIVRTAGAKRTKSEITRDYEYLQMLWSRIRNTTLESTAPARIHQEGGLVHRAMRDMFDREIEEVVIQGDDAYREAKDLAKTLMPTQARKVKRWTSSAPLFVSESIEDQLDSIFDPIVQMKSGGYLVINQTEALVAIDVNSGKSTKERSIEQTALNTNLEAAEEACRQMRLRDLAGLVVIDFIDMDENKNNRAVEKKMKECLKLDRARVQNSRISQFGLMEISRQRRRAGVMQATSEKCQSCNGTGRRRSIPSSALQLLRAIEARAAGQQLKGLTVTAPTEVAIYLLNSKRDAITAIEEDAGFTIAIQSDAEMIPGSFTLDAEKASGGRRRSRKLKRSDFIIGDEDDHLLPTDEDDDEDDDETVASDDDADSDNSSIVDTDTDERGNKKRRRRGRRGGRRRKREDDRNEAATPPSDGGALLDGLVMSAAAMLSDGDYDLPDAMQGGLDANSVALPIAAKTQAGNTKAASDANDNQQDETGGRKKRRRRRKKRDRSDENSNTNGSSDDNAETTDNVDASDQTENAPDQSADERPKKRRRRTRTRQTEESIGESSESSSDASSDKPGNDETTEQTDAPATQEEVADDGPVNRADDSESSAASEDDSPSAETSTTSVFKPDAPIATEPRLETETQPTKKKRGWWSRG